MTRHRRPGRLALAGGLALALGLAGMAAAWVDDAGGPVTVEIPIRYSKFERTEVTVRAGQPVTFVLHNGDPIDHEWIVGESDVHERHRTGTEPVHGSRPTEVTVSAGATATTTVTFSKPGTYLYICHLPGHEAYGMVGTVRVTVADRRAGERAAGGGHPRAASAKRTTDMTRRLSSTRCARSPHRTTTSPPAARRPSRSPDRRSWAAGC